MLISQNISFIMEPAQQKEKQTRKSIQKFTKEEDLKILEYYSKPANERIPRKEFAKSINHSPRSVNERFKQYLSSCRKFSNDELIKLLSYTQEFGQRWTFISKRFGSKFSPLILRDKYKFLVKNNLTIESLQNENKQQSNEINNDEIWTTVDEFDLVDNFNFWTIDEEFDIAENIRSQYF